MAKRVTCKYCGVYWDVPDDWACVSSDVCIQCKIQKGKVRVLRA